MRNKIASPNFKTYLLFFQVWIISGSVMPFSAACLSNMSNKNLIAWGTSPLDNENIDTNKSLTKCCRVPLVVSSRVRYISGTWTNVFWSESIVLLVFVFVCDENSWRKSPRKVCTYQYQGWNWLKNTLFSIKLKKTSTFTHQVIRPEPTATARSPSVQFRIARVEVNGAI